MPRPRVMSGLRPMLRSRDLQNRRLPLPRIEMVVETGDKTCPCCNGELHQISEDNSERLGPKRRYR